MKMVSKDRVLIEGLTISTTIGVYDWEKKIKQKLILDLEMAWDNQPAGKSDDISLCLDYFQVSQAISTFIQSSKFELIECVAEQVADLVIKKFGVKWIKVKVSKPGAITNANNVAVLIERNME